MSDIIKKQVEAYRPNFLEHGNTPKGTFQNNTTTQNERFKQLLKPLLELKPNGFSICDIGSGVCDLHKYLLEQNIEHHYTGIEIVPEMVKTSQEAYPETTILNIDILSDEFVQKFDFVVLSGTFNLLGKVEEKEWEKFIFKIVNKMFDCTTIAIAFNSLTSYSTFRAEELYYLAPEKMLAHIQEKLSRFYSINHISPLYETTYCVIKKEIMKGNYIHSDFEKYFKN